MRLSIEASIYHVCWLNTNDLRRIAGQRVSFCSSRGSTFDLHTVSNEVVSWNVWLPNEYRSTPSLCRGFSPRQTHMELWVMSQALTDRTGCTCLYAVYTTATHVCTLFVFSLCGVQNTEECCLNLHLVLFCFTYFAVKSSIPPEQLKCSYCFWQFLINLCDPQTSRSYSFQIFVSILN